MFSPGDREAGSPGAGGAPTWGASFLMTLRARVRAEGVAVVAVDDAQRLTLTELRLFRDLADTERATGRRLVLLDTRVAGAAAGRRAETARPNGLARWRRSALSRGLAAAPGRPLVSRSPSRLFVPLPTVENPRSRYFAVAERINGSASSGLTASSDVSVSGRERGGGEAELSVRQLPGVLGLNGSLDLGWREA
jgi:hypothetical protein